MPMMLVVPSRDPIHLLADQHAALCRLLLEIRDTPVPKRGARVAELADRLHAYLEMEAVLQPVLRRLHNDPAVTADRRAAQGGPGMPRWARGAEPDLMAALAQMVGAVSWEPAFRPALQRFMDVLAVHAEVQEASMFPLLRRHCGQRELRLLGGQMEAVAARSAPGTRMERH